MICTKSGRVTEAPDPPGRRIFWWASKIGMTRGLFRRGFGVLFRGCGDGSFLGILEAVLGHAEAVRSPPLHGQMHAPVCTLLLSFRPTPFPWAQVKFRSSHFIISYRISSYFIIIQDVSLSIIFYHFALCFIMSIFLTKAFLSYIMFTIRHDITTFHHCAWFSVAF